MLLLQFSKAETHSDLQQNNLTLPTSNSQ